MSYTRGVWKIRERGISSEIFVETPLEPIVKEYQIAGGIYNKANARLIAAAPEMYEFCRELLFSLDTGYERLGAGRVGTLINVLAKAEVKEG